MAAPVAQTVAPSRCCPGRDVEEGRGIRPARVWDGAWPMHQPEAVWLLTGAASPGETDITSQKHLGQVTVK